MLDRLPYEIFRDIIKSLHMYSPNFPKRFDWDELCAPPVNESHVCRSWRAALLSDPGLWTCIEVPNMSPNKINEMLRRSQSMPLQVVINSFLVPPRWITHFPDALASLFEEIHRFKRLQIIFLFTRKSRKMAYRVLPYLDRPAPTLRELYVDLEWATDEKFLRRLFSCGNSLNSQQMDRIVSANFNELLRSPGQLFQGLSGLHLILEDTKVIHGDALFDIIEQSPGLHTLGLVSTHSQSISISPDRQFHLPHLRRLSIVGGLGCDMSNLVLRHFIFPSEKVDYLITCDDLQFKRSDSALLLSFLAKQHLASLEIKSAKNFVVSQLSTNPGMTDKPGESRLITRYDNLEEPVDNLPNFLRMFKLSDVTYLCLECSIPLNSRILRDIFSSLVNLEHLYIDQEGRCSIMDASFLMALIPWPAKREAQAQACLEQETSDIMHFLDIETSQDIISEQDDLIGSAFTFPSIMFPCPSLTTLDLKIGSESWEIEEPWELDERYARLIAICSDIRRQAGHPFKTITIHCLESTLTKRAQDILQPHNGFPVAIDFQAIM